MGLFDKKFCDICGDKIGLLGNRKLEDGNLCKNCASKLSPWFSDRRSSTVEDIKAQLAYREENQQKVAEFNVTRTLGKEYYVLIDEDHDRFCVTRSRDYRSDNPDILDFTQVTGCDLDIEESKTEVKREDAEGKKVSYDPPRYDYSYDFYIDLRVNHPWFDQMRFQINPSSVDIDYGSTMPAAAAAARPTPPAQQGQRPAPPPRGQHPAPGGRPPMKPGAGQHPVMNAAKQAILGGTAASAAYDPSTNAEYQQYVAMGNEIREAILKERQEARDTVAEANAPKTAVQCPHCGASTIPDANGCCEFCGSALGAVLS